MLGLMKKSAYVIYEWSTSQQESNFDLKSHPNGEQNLPAQTRATSVRIRAPPGGQSSGFW